MIPRIATSALVATAIVLGVACGTDPPRDMSVRGPAPTHPSPEQVAEADRLLTAPDWYRHAVFYEVNVRSFQDSNGDGIGDLSGLVSRLDYLKELGIDALWLMPIFPSGFKDSGYDIKDYRTIDPVYGDVAAFDRLLTEAHARKMRVLLDLVLNHTSDQHAWFKESRASKTNPKADWYLWSDTASRADLGNCQPDNPRFGNLWTKDEPRGQFFYHRFYPEQPDLNYRNADVVKETLDVARFWLDRGTDGFRCDVIGKLYESPEGCDMIPETIAYVEKLRAVLDATPGRVMVAEPSDFHDSTKYFGNGSDRFHMTFDFGFGYFWSLAFGSGDKKIIDDAITASLRYPKAAQPAQVIGSHDVPRQYTANDPWRRRNAALIQMTLRGTPFIYYGEEVGLQPGAQIVVDDRDFQRTPMTWTAAAGHGFTTGTPWIAFGTAPETTAVDVADTDPSSTLTYYRQLLAFRRGHPVWSTGDLRLVSLDTQAVVAYVREAPGARSAEGGEKIGGVGGGAPDGEDAKERYLVAVSLSEEDQDATAPSDGLSAGELVFGSGSMEVTGGTLRVKLPGMSGAIFRMSSQP